MAQAEMIPPFATSFEHDHTKWDDYGNIDEETISTGLDPLGCFKKRLAKRTTFADAQVPWTNGHMKHFWKLHHMFHDRYILADVGNDIREAHEQAVHWAGDKMPDASDFRFGRPPEDFEVVKRESLAEYTDDVRQYYGHRYAMRKLKGDVLSEFEQVVYDYISRKDSTCYKLREVGMLSKLYMMYLKDLEVDRCRELCTSVPDGAVNEHGLGTMYWEDQPIEAIGGYIPLQANLDMCIIFRTFASKYMVTLSLTSSAANHFLMQSLSKNPHAKVKIGPWSITTDIPTGFPHIHKNNGIITLND